MVKTEAKIASDNGKIQYPDSKCSQSPTGAHHFIIYQESVWWCKYCYTPVWKPIYSSDADNFGSMIRYKGVLRAYQAELKSRPDVVKLIRLIQLSNELSEKYNKEE